MALLSFEQSSAVEHVHFTLELPVTSTGIPVGDDTKRQRESPGVVASTTCSGPVDIAHEQ